MEAIALNRLTKDYGKGRGIFDLSFGVHAGEAYGFIGPNGAGKTTAIRHLMGFLNPDSGGCTIRGLDCRTRPRDIHPHIGYVPGEISFFDGIRGAEYLRFCERIRGQGTAGRKAELLERFELDPSGEVRKMSKGMKQKLGLVAAFLHDPDILILDEPTSGLDPLMQQRFVDLVRMEKARGKTLLISSHSFEEIEKTCDRVGILKEGQMVADQAVRQLQKARRRVFSVSFATQEALEDFLKEGFDAVPGQGHRADVTVVGELAPFLTALARHPVTGLDVMTQSLEEVFLQYYGGQAHD